MNKVNVLTNFEHNTPLVLYLDDKIARIKLQVHSCVMDAYDKIRQKFNIPSDLCVKSSVFTPKPFDAILKTMGTKRNA